MPTNERITRMQFLAAQNQDLDLQINLLLCRKNMYRAQAAMFAMQHYIKRTTHYELSDYQFKKVADEIREMQLKFMANVDEYLTLKDQTP